MIKNEEEHRKAIYRLQDIYLGLVGEMNLNHKQVEELIQEKTKLENEVDNSPFILDDNENIVSKEIMNNHWMIILKAALEAVENYNPKNMKELIPLFRELINKPDESDNSIRIMLQTPLWFLIIAVVNEEEKL